MLDIAEPIAIYIFWRTIRPRLTHMSSNWPLTWASLSIIGISRLVSRVRKERRLGVFPIVSMMVGLHDQKRSDSTLLSAHKVR